MPVDEAGEEDEEEVGGVEHREEVLVQEANIRPRRLGNVVRYAVLVTGEAIPEHAFRVDEVQHNQVL